MPDYIDELMERAGYVPAWVKAEQQRIAQNRARTELPETDPDYLEPEEEK